MKKMKVLLATLLAFAMMAPMAMAATTSEKTVVVGEGSYANPSSANVWSIEFPTANRASFTIDPKLMVKDSGRFGDTNVEANKTMLFPVYDNEGALTDMKGESGELKVINRGSKDVSVELNIRPTDTQMKIRAAAIDADDTDPSIFFQAKNTMTNGAAVAAASQTLVAIPAVGANLDATIPAATANFESKWDGSKFTMTRKEGVENDSDTWKYAGFVLTGAANTNANAVWDDSLSAPNLALTWSVRTSEDESIAVEFASGIAAPTSGNYVMAADCKMASPGQVVTVYVKPKEADSASLKGYWIDPGDDAEESAANGPGLIQTAVLNNLTGEIVDDATGDQFVRFSNGVSSDNGTVAYTFMVPNKDDGPASFTKTKTNASNAIVANKIVIARGPTISKVTSEVELEALT